MYIKTIEDIKNFGDLSIAHGFFDGVHLAHQTLIKNAKEYALNNDCLCGVVTLDKKHVYNDKASFLKSLKISSLERRLELFKHFGVDIVFILSFDNFKSIGAKEYIEDIIVPIGTKHFVMGIDNAFGSGKEGNAQNISQLASNAFSVDSIDLIEDYGVKISSSEIKALVMEESIELSNEKLGYYYKITGKVVRGKQLGREIGYPTANLKMKQMVIIPKISAYATIVKIDGKLYHGMTNVGYNPTTDFREDLSVETYIFDFKEEIYGKEMCVYFISTIRDEIKFDGIEALLAQLKKDEIKVKEVLDNIDIAKII